MRFRPQPTERVLLLAFLAIAVVFLLGIAMGQRYVWRIHSATADITANSAPSIRILSGMRSSVRTLEVLADDYVDACAAGRCGPTPARLPALRESLLSEWQTYKQLPAFPHEKESWAGLEGQLARLDSALDAIEAHLRRGDPRQAENALNQSLKPACNQLDAAIAAMSEFDDIQGRQVALQIDQLARRSMALSLFLGAAGTLLAVMTALLAIRFVKSYEQLLQKRADDLDRFAGQVAHDVLSPLSGVGIAIGVAQRDATPQARDQLERALRSLLRARDLVNALLSFARAGAQPALDSAADLQSVMAGVLDEVHDLAGEKGVTLRVGETVPARIGCSTGVLMSVLGNTVRNAVKYMGDRPQREVRLRARLSEKGMVRIEIEDTGPGIPDSLGERVFEPFVRGSSDSSGSGLGLATARRLVTAHGGRIGFHSVAGHGTTFWVELPRA